MTGHRPFGDACGPGSRQDGRAADGVSPLRASIPIAATMLERITAELAPLMMDGNIRRGVDGEIARRILEVMVSPTRAMRHAANAYAFRQPGVSEDAAKTLSWDIWMGYRTMMKAALAQGIEAPSGGETALAGSTSGESPVGPADAPEGA